MRSGEQEPRGRKSQTKSGWWLAPRGAEQLYQSSGSCRAWVLGPASGRSTLEEGRHFRAGTQKHWSGASKSAWTS